MLSYRFDNWNAGNTINELTIMLISLNVPIVNNKNISRKHLGYKGLHLNSYWNECDLCHQEILK